ncbi:MAG: ABC transporter permease, partial [Chloroflexia bacterium]|nr:ABC transporter permease [Chloroflexia bacterium]
MERANVVAAGAGDVPASGGIRLVSQRERAWRTFKGNRTAVVGLVLIILIVAVAIAAPLLVPHDPYDQSTRNRLADPGGGYLLGRDDYGRDVLSRVIYGTRVALLVGIVSVAFGGLLGTAIGVVAGYLGGKVDAALMRFVDVLLAFPD